MKRGWIHSVTLLSAGAFLTAVLSIPATRAASPASQPSGSSKSEALGKTSSWTETTNKAAGTPEQKAVLEGGKAATITGELVDVSCYLQLGKRGEAHIPCGSDCIRHGQPAGIVDASGKLTILFVEEHDPRRLGEIDIKDKLAGLLAKQVSATGMLTKGKDGTQALYVHGSEVNAAK